LQPLPKRQDRYRADIYLLQDPKIAKLTADAMAVSKARIRKRPLKVQDQACINLQYLIVLTIRTSAKNNQMVYFWGGSGRAEFSLLLRGLLRDRNTHGHTTVCQGSLYSPAGPGRQYDAINSAGGEILWQADFETQIHPFRRVKSLRCQLEHNRNAG
jgi:hypothetical protein